MVADERYIAESFMSFCEEDGPSFFIEERQKKVFVGPNLPDHLVFLIKQSPLVKKVFPSIDSFLDGQKDEIRWCICAYQNFTFLLFQRPRKKLVYIDSVEEIIAEKIKFFAKQQGTYLDLLEASAK
jgi:hypothetical protein